MQIYVVHESGKYSMPRQAYAHVNLFSAQGLKKREP